MNNKELLKAFSEVDERYLALTETQTREKRTVPMRRVLAVAVAAAISVSVLTVTAMATGLLPSPFQQVRDRAAANQAAQEQELFARAQEASVHQMPETRNLPKLDASSITLTQSYYDGQTALLAYDLESLLPEPVVGYAVDEELLRGLRSSNLTRGYGIDAETYEAKFGSLPDYAREYHVSRDVLHMDAELRNLLSAEDYQTMQKMLVANGAVCVVVQDLYRGDHILVNGVDTFAMEYPVEEGECIGLGSEDQEPLPEAARNQESITVELKIKSSYCYYYMELEGHAYQCYQPGQEERVQFTLERVQELEQED